MRLFFAKIVRLGWIFMRFPNMYWIRITSQTRAYGGLTNTHLGPPWTDAVILATCIFPRQKNKVAA